MTDQEDLYWLTNAVETFNRRVWNKGLLRFASDKVEGTAAEFFKHTTCIIAVYGKEGPMIKIAIKSLDVIVFLEYFIETPDQPPVLTFREILPATEVLEEAADIWEAGKFKLISD